MTVNMARVRAVLRKEVRDYRRNRFVTVTMTIMPVLFIVTPIVTIFSVPASAPESRIDTLIGVSLLYLMLIPTLVPAVISAYTVVGEREQGTLEPVLTTPVRREEILLGKALAVFIPTLLISYTMYGVFLACVGLFGHPNVAAEIFQPSRILSQLLFTPLLAGWSIWADIAISTRSSDVRVAQQLGVLASLPPLAMTALMGFGVIRPTLTLALGVAAVLLLIDILAWRLVSAMFDRERLVTGNPASR